jgi:hypothetical protein
MVAIAVRSVRDRRFIADTFLKGLTNEGWSNDKSETSGADSIGMFRYGEPTGDEP